MSHNPRIIQSFDRHNAMLCVLEIDRSLSSSEQEQLSQRANCFGRGGPDSENKPKYYLEFRKEGQEIVVRQRGATPAPTIGQFAELLEELDLKPTNFPTTTTPSSAASSPARSANKSRSANSRAAI